MHTNVHKVDLLRYLGGKNLTPLQVSPNLLGDFWELVQKSAFPNGLNRKGRVPALTSIVTLHLHAVFGDP